MSLMFGSWSMISILHMCVFQTSYCVLNVWHIIYDLPSICLCLLDFYSVLILRHFVCEHRCFCLCPPEVNTVLPNVRRIIYNYSRICSCPPETNTVSSELFTIASSTVPYHTILLDISSMIIILYVCVFQS